MAVNEFSIPRFTIGFMLNCVDHLDGDYMCVYMYKTKLEFEKPLKVLTIFDKIKRWLGIV